MQAGPVGDDIDVDLLALGAIIFDDIGGVVERQIHHGGIVLIDLDRKPMGRLHVACESGGDSREKEAGREGRQTAPVTHNTNSLKYWIDAQTKSEEGRPSQQTEVAEVSDYSKARGRRRYRHTIAD